MRYSCHFGLGEMAYLSKRAFFSFWYQTCGGDLQKGAEDLSWGRSGWKSVYYSGGLRPQGFDCPLRQAQVFGSCVERDQTGVYGFAPLLVMNVDLTLPIVKTQRNASPGLQDADSFNCGLRRSVFETKLTDYDVEGLVSKRKSFHGRTKVEAKSR